MNEPRCIAQLLRNESPRAIDFTITHGIRASPEQASMEFYGGKSPKIASVHQFGLSEETRKDGKKIDYPARPLLGFTSEDVQMIEEIILAHLDR